MNRIRDIRLLGISKDSDKRYKNLRSWDLNVNEQGWRFHMSNIMAAIGIEQLKKFKFFQSKRKKLANLYLKLLKNISEIEFLNIDYNLITPHFCN